MATTNFAKFIYFLTGSSFLLVGAYGFKTWIIGDRIVDLLKIHNPKKQLLSPISSIDKWKKSWFKYREFNKGRNRDVWNLSDWKKEDNVIQNVRAPVSFIEACEEKSKERATSVSYYLYQEVLKWCTGSSKIKDLIKDSGKRILTDKDSKDSEQYGWKPLLKKYYEIYKSQIFNPLSIDLSSFKEGVENKEIIEKFKEKCKALSDKEVSGTTDPIYEKVKNYCSANIKAEDVIRDSFPSKKLIDLTKIKNAEGKVSPLAQTIWDKYKSNKKDPWKIISSSNLAQVPDEFWNKCAERRKQEVKGTEDEAFKEVLNYCTVDARDTGNFGE